MKTKQPTTKQLLLLLPDDLHREIKARCAEEGRSIVSLMTGLARLYLAGKVKLPKDNP